MLASKTLSYLFLRYILIVLGSLVSFMVGLDVMGNAEKLPDSANLVMLYLMFKSFYAIDMMLPISLVFAFIATMVEMIRTNALAAYYAIGYSKLRILKPFLVVASVLTMIHIALHATNFSRANTYANNIRDTSQLLRPTTDLFFAHEGNYIYFGNLYPLTKKAEDIRIFTFEPEKGLRTSISAMEATYADGHWNLRNAHILQAPLMDSLQTQGVITNNVENIRTLPDFKPKILDQVYEGKSNFSIIDGIDALLLLKDQNVDVSNIMSAMYRIFITPWFAVILMVIIYTYTPISSRFLNLSFFSFVGILTTLLIWGVMFVFNQLALTKTLSPEMGVVVPIVTLVAVMVGRLNGELRRIRIKSSKMNELKGI